MIQGYAQLTEEQLSKGRIDVIAVVTAQSAANVLVASAEVRSDSVMNNIPWRRSVQVSFAGDVNNLTNYGMYTARQAGEVCTDHMMPA